MKRRSIIGYTLLLLTIAVFGLLASSCSGRESSVISAQENELSEADYKRYEDLSKQSADEEFVKFGQFAYNASEECLKNNPDAEPSDCDTAAYVELLYSYLLLEGLFNELYSELIDTDTHEGYRKASGTWAECMSREGYEYSYADKGDLFSDLENQQASVYEEKGNTWDARVSARELEITAYKAYNNCYFKSGLTEVLGELDNTVLSAMRTREEHTIKIGEYESGDEKFITLSGAEVSELLESTGYIHLYKNPERLHRLLPVPDRLPSEPPAGYTPPPLQGSSDEPPAPEEKKLTERSSLENFERETITECMAGGGSEEDCEAEFALIDRTTIHRIYNLDKWKVSWTEDCIGNRRTIWASADECLASYDENISVARRHVLALGELRREQIVECVKEQRPEVDAPAAVLLRSNHSIVKECREVFSRDGDRADVVGPRGVQSSAFGVQSIDSCGVEEGE